MADGNDQHEPTTGASRLTTALRYAAYGWHVLPLWTVQDGRCACGKDPCPDKPGKHPYQGLGVTHATEDGGVLHRWFAGGIDKNLGIAMGASSLVVVDIDGAPGEASWTGILAAAGQSEPRTLQAASGRPDGGRHLYFTTAEPFGKPNTSLAGIDVKSGNSYVVAPPSVHVSGSRYRWLTKGARPAPLPAWLREQLEKPKQPEPNGSQPVIDPSRKYIPGQRGARLRHLFGILNSEGFELSTIIAAVQDENRRCFDPPKSEAEIRSEVEDVWRQYHAQNGQAPAARGEAPGEAEGGQPYALSLDDFIARKLDTKPPLLGTVDDNLLPVGGLAVLFGKGGNGKTTAAIDAAMHFASAVNWLGFEVQRPLRVLIVENEGPVEPFRRKLEHKRRAWPHPIHGALFIKTFDWGACTLADSAERRRLRDFIEREQIDLVMGDPLDSLGIEGVGSPADTRAFMKLLVDVGLTRDVAFWLLHHPLKAEVTDELDEASGAWGGRPDTMLRLAARPGSRARLSFPKVRWGLKHGPHILAFDKETAGFEVVAVEDGKERDLLAEIRALMADHGWRTAREIAGPKKPKDGSAPGIGANDRVVKKILDAHPDLFTSRNGKELGRSAQATLWNCVDPPTQLTQLARPEGEEGATASLRPTYREVGPADAVAPPASETPTQSTQTPPDADTRTRAQIAGAQQLGMTVITGDAT